MTVLYGNHYITRGCPSRVLWAENTGARLGQKTSAPVFWFPPYGGDWGAFGAAPVPAPGGPGLGRLPRNPGGKPEGAVMKITLRE